MSNNSDKCKLIDLERVCKQLEKTPKVEEQGAMPK